MRLTKRGERVAALALFTPVFASALFMPSAHDMTPAHKHKIIVQALACEYGDDALCHGQDERIDLIWRWTKPLHQVKNVCADPIPRDEVRRSWRNGFCLGEVDIISPEVAAAGDQGMIVRILLALGRDETED
jgi:hypothetical protein